MTVEQAKEKYGIKSPNATKHIGYVYCAGCPLDKLDENHCPGHCNGYEKAWEAIAKYMSEFEPKNDPVSHPSHYTQGGIECIDAMVAAYGEEAVKHFCMCNAFKYVWRAEHKNGAEDIDKAIWYLNKFKELSEND